MTDGIAGDNGQTGQGADFVTDDYPPFGLRP
jgi:hypothetical protein